MTDSGSGQSADWGELTPCQREALSSLPPAHGYTDFLAHPGPTGAQGKKGNSHFFWDLYP